MLREFGLAAIALALIACHHDLRSLYTDAAVDGPSADANDLGTDGADSGRVLAAQIVAGENFTCARMTNATVRCWGSHENGQIGIGVVAFEDGGVIGVNSPREVHGLTGVTALTLGTMHACAIVGGGLARCWGSANTAEIDDQGTRIFDEPVPLEIGLGSSMITVREVAAGASHTCARTSDGLVRCRGSNVVGELGAGEPGPVTLPSLIRTLAAHEQIVAGRYHNCVLMADHTVQCWGWNEYRQLGSAGMAACPLVEDAGLVSCAVSPAAVDPPITTAMQLAAGQLHTCALLSDRSVWCWGANQGNQLGSASTTTCPISIADPSPCTQAPTRVTGFADDVIQISAGGFHTCATLRDGHVKCWGSNQYGQLGIEHATGLCTIEGSMNVPCEVTPTVVPGIDNAVEVACGGSHTCARLNNGGVFCWGLNIAGQVGTGDFLPGRIPSEVFF